MPNSLRAKCSGFNPRLPGSLLSLDVFVKVCVTNSDKRIGLIIEGVVLKKRYKNNDNQLKKN